jgi:hypothetical protein
VGVLDAVVVDAQLVEPRGPLLELAAVGAAEGHVVETGAALVELVTRAGREGVQAEQLTAVEGVHGVVEAPLGLVLVEDRRRPEQGGVPLGAPVEIGHGHGNMGNSGKSRHNRPPGRKRTCVDDERA